MLTVICIVIIMTINRWKVKNLCDCVSNWNEISSQDTETVLSYKFWSAGHSTLESLNSGTGKTQIVYVEETLQWVIWMASRRFSASSNWCSKNMLLVIMLFDMIACWLIHTELNSVLGRKIEGNWGSGTRDWKTWSGTQGRKFLNPWRCLPRACIQQSEMQVRILVTLFLAWFISTYVQHINASDPTPIISDWRLWTQSIHLWGHLMSQHMALLRKHTLPVQQVQLLYVTAG